MKAVITAVALATFFASPVFAKTLVNHHRAAATAASTQGLYMQAAPRYQGAPLGTSGTTGGQDPDSNIRSELNRDYGQSQGAY
jgi:hypothetical protein